MLKMTVKQLKGGFLDRKAVTDVLGKRTAGVLAKQAAYVRGIARRELKKKAGPAPAGKPPNMHEGSLKRFLLFAFDRQSNSVVVGPAKLGKSNAPGLLDHGGKVAIKGYVDRHGRFRPLDTYPRRIRDQIIAKGKVTTRTVTIAPRPFMGPALKIAAPKLASFWTNQVTK